MGIATLADIITKIRKLTGSANSFQLTDTQIIDYINSYYLYDFPAQYRSLKLKDKYTFNTTQNVDTYPFDSEHYTTVEMPCYCSKREILLYQDPWTFYGMNFNWQQFENFDTGDGTTGPYSGIAQSTPIIRSVWNNPMVKTEQAPTSSYYPNPIPAQPSFSNSQIPSRVQNILITTSTGSSTLNVTDNGAGLLIGDCTNGSINYQTGVISNLVFTGIVPQGNNIQIQYNPVQTNKPLYILYFQNQFTLRPCPDQGYTIELVAYRLPSQALLGSTDSSNPNTTGVPELKEWWETIAFGAAKKVYEDRLDADGVMLMDKSLKERLFDNETRTYAQLGKQRIGTIFSDQLNNTYSGFGGFGFGGN